MEIAIIIISCLVIASAFFHIRAEYSGPKYFVYIFKPLTMVFIISLAIFSGSTNSSLYKYLIITGLFFSLAGDIFLMLPSDRFIQGLVSFLVAHVFYIIAFTQNISFTFSPWFFFILAIYGIFIYKLLYPNLGKKKIPVALYILIILLMGETAFNQWQVINSDQAMFAFIGAILFIISDSSLAFNRFRKPFKISRLLILTTYFSAQWFIAMSI
jgi:uncharacterized membrane protein YhhN